MADSRNYLFVAALNLCPEYSWYSFSANDDPMKLENPLKTPSSTWQQSRQNSSSKTPTCLLLNGKRELVAFGYEAESQWAELVLDEEQDDYYYFDESKMCLYNNKVYALNTIWYSYFRNLKCTSMIKSRIKSQSTMQLLYISL